MQVELDVAGALAGVAEAPAVVQPVERTAQIVDEDLLLRLVERDARREGLVEGVGLVVDAGWLRTAGQVWWDVGEDCGPVVGGGATDTDLLRSANPGEVGLL